jgi:hypothetical protein
MNLRLARKIVRQPTRYSRHQQEAAVARILRKHGIRRWVVSVTHYYSSAQLFSWSVRFRFPSSPGVDRIDILRHLDPLCARVARGIQRYERRHAEGM